MIWRLLPTALALTGVLGAVWWVVALHGDREALRDQVRDLRVEVASKDAALRQAEEAARVHRAYVARAEEERARWAEIERQLMTMEDGDAPLSDFLGDAAGRVFGP